VLESGQIEKPHFAPNISLNFLNPEKHSSAVRDGQPRKLRAVQAAFAVTVQAGVLAFFGVLTFRLNLSAGAGRPSPKVGFGLTFSGTIFLVLGLFICATVIEQRTTEENWSSRRKGERRDNKRDAFDLFWIQNRKSDRDGIESWILFSDEPRHVLVTSHPNKEGEKKSLKNVLVCCGVGLGVSGFLMQLFGIRMMHWSAAIAQLVATLIMVAVRAVSRRHLSDSPKAWSLPDKHELDWVATRLERKPAQSAADNDVCLFKDHLGDRRFCEPNNSCQFWSKGCWKWSVAMDKLDLQETTNGFSEHPNLDGDGHLVFMVRQRLGYMSRQMGTKWTPPWADIAVGISKAIGDCMNLLQKDPPALGQTKFWSMPVCVCDRGTENNCRCDGNIYFRVHWDGKWKSVPEEIEAYLSLWLFELKPTVRSDSLKCPKGQRLGKATFSLKDDLQEWVGFGAKSNRTHEEDGHILLDFEANLPTLCTHQLLFRFLKTVISDKKFKPINSRCALKLDNPAKSWRDFRLRNKDITDLAQKVKDRGLGRFEHVMVCIVAILSQANKLPECPEILEYVRSRALDFKSRGQFSEAADIYKELLSRYKGGPGRMKTGACALSFVFREQLKEIVSVMQSEATIAGDQQAAKAKIKRVQAALQLIEGALRQITDDTIHKLEHLYKIHHDKVMELGTYRENGLDDLGWNKAHYSMVDRLPQPDITLVNKPDPLPPFDITLVNKPDMFGQTPLHEAAKGGLVDFTRSFIDDGAHLDAEDEEGKTALHLAAQYGQLCIVEILVFSGASIHKVDKSGKCPLHWLPHAQTLNPWPTLRSNENITEETTAKEVESKMKSVMPQFWKVSDFHDHNGRTALHLAAGLGCSIVLLEHLIQLRDRKEVNARDGRSMTPLHAAVQGGNLSAVKQLLENGANREAKDITGNTALDVATQLCLRKEECAEVWFEGTRHHLLFER
jgi:hypothetical protein